MTSTNSAFRFRRTLLAVSSAAIALTAASAAQAQDRPDFVENTSTIIVRNDINPNTPAPGGALDLGVTGVGQMIVLNQAAGTLGLCSGTLVNPRTVIFAAHCVNTRPADAYGARTGNAPNDGPFGPQAGVPISFGFEATNRCQGVAVNGCVVNTGPYELWRDSDFETQTDRHIYNVNQVWYDTRSLTAPGSQGFLVADVAVATLDTPANNVPTWSMLFSPLDGPTHGLQMGYGVNGTSASAQGPGPCPPGTNCSPLGGIDYRRRSAENVISVLGSFDDRDDFLFGPGTSLQNNLYMLGFNDPDPAYNPAAGKYDFGLFGDSALPREGTTAGGDSGGPLVADQRYDRPVVVAVLSGGSRFFAAQRFSTYGTHSFYQPLHLYWDEIVRNNAYVYASNRAGTRDWTDARHWVQDMDPSYLIDVGGQLVNSLPDTPAQGIAGGGAKFGQFCFLGDCESISGTQAPGNGTPVFIPGGPGSTNFVPNNVDPNAVAGIKARYYDVTLSALGTTRVTTGITIDKLTLDGRSTLEVRNGGNLNVLGDFTQFSGDTVVDGRLASGEAFLMTGSLGGTGTFDPTFLTVAAGLLEPGGSRSIGTLTIQGDLVLASAAGLSIDVNGVGADRLAVTGDADNAGIAALGGTVLFNRAAGTAPRANQAFDFVTAAGGVQGTFAQSVSQLGVLTPELTYGTNFVRATLRAGSLRTLATGGGAATPTALAFAGALDGLRATSYDRLYGLYGAVDLMDATTLGMTLTNMTPRIATETRMLQERQSRMMLSAVTDRLSLLGTGSLSGGLSVVGSPQSLLAIHGVDNGLANADAQRSFALGMMPGTRSIAKLPETMSGFISGGLNAGTASYGEAQGNQAGQRYWHIGMGLEMEVAPSLTVGTAFGYSAGYSLPGEQARSDSRTSQVAVYGSYRLGGGAYVAGLASAESSRADLERRATTGDLMFDLAGATTSTRYNLRAEAGVNMELAKGLTLTPRAALGYASYSFGDYREQGGDAALAIDKLGVQRLEARVGAQLAGAKAFRNGWSFVPQLQADYVQALSGANDGMTVRFVNAGDHSFVLPVAGGDAGWAEVKGGLKLTNGKFGIGAGVESSFGRSDYRDNRAVADFTIRF